LLLQHFLVIFGAPVVGLDINPWVAAAVGLTLNSGAFLGEIWRGCIEAIPRGQWEAAEAVGLSYRHKMRDVVLPQALKIAVPPTVGYLVQIVKGTSLAAIIGFTELTRAGQIINNATFEPMVVFSVVALIYFLLCWPLSLLAAHMERRMSVSLTR
jgi:polar amino acid transport system permease protein